jgi:hypothetical protein
LHHINLSAAMASLKHLKGLPVFVGSKHVSDMSVYQPDDDQGFLTVTEGEEMNLLVAKLRNLAHDLGVSVADLTNLQTLYRADAEGDDPNHKYAYVTKFVDDNFFWKAVPVPGQAPSRGSSSRPSTTLQLHNKKSGKPIYKVSVLGQVASARFSMRRPGEESPFAPLGWATGLTFTTLVGHPRGWLPFVLIACIFNLYGEMCLAAEGKSRCNSDVHTPSHCLAGLEHLANGPTGGPPGSCRFVFENDKATSAVDPRVALRVYCAPQSGSTADGQVPVPDDFIKQFPAATDVTSALGQLDVMPSDVSGQSLAQHLHSVCVRRSFAPKSYLPPCFTVVDGKTCLVPPRLIEPGLLCQFTIRFPKLTMGERRVPYCVMEECVVVGRSFLVRNGTEAAYLSGDAARAAASTDEGRSLMEALRGNCVPALCAATSKDEDDSDDAHGSKRVCGAGS